MSDITISYKGSSIATMDATGTKTLLTEGKYCEDDIEVAYVKPSGGGAVPIKDVVFWDYDGTPLYSYTLTEANALTALPANPSHEGLTAQGWNWTLQDIKDQISECPGGTIDVGQSYITDDGKTRIYVKIPDGEPLTFYVRLWCSAVGNCTIDWGDGNTELTTQTNTKSYAHTYAASGSYTIKLSVSTGSIKFVDNNGSDRIYGPYAKGYNRTRIKKIEFGSNILQIGDYALRDCFGLESITIPTSATDFGVGVLSASYALKGVVFPKSDSYTYGYGNILTDCFSLFFISQPKNMKMVNHGSAKNLKRVTITKATFRQDNSYEGTGIRRAVYPSTGYTTIDNGKFRNCNMLEEFNIPSTITAIGSEAFKQCYSLSIITIPSSVTVINNSAFHTINGLQEVHVKPTTPPTLGTNVFYSAPSDLVIYVPNSADHSILNNYQTASNWSAYASKMQEEPQS